MAELSRLKQLQEQRATAHAAAVALLNKEQTAETRASVDRAFADVDSLGADIARIQKADTIEAEMRAAGGTTTATIPVGSGDPALVDPEKLAKEYRKAFISVLRNRNTGNIGFGRDSSVGQNGMSAVAAETRATMDKGLAFAKSNIEQRDLIEGAPITGHIGTYSGLGYFVPTGFVNAIEQATKYFCPLLDGSVITVMDTATGQPLPFPVSNDTTQQATILGEAAQIVEQDVVASQIIFGAYKFTSGLCRVSLELMQDSAFDLEAWLVNLFAIRWGRGLENYLTNGTGVAQPLGLLTAVAQSGATPTVAAGSSETTGGSQTGANSIGYSDLVNLEHAVDPSYRRGAKYMFHDQTLSALKRIIDKFGRPLWTPGIGTDVGDTINGYSYVINQSMPQIAASNVTVAFGDLKKYIARRVKDLTVMKLVERYADFGEVGFVSFARLDANLIDAGTHPVEVLQQHS